MVQWYRIRPPLQEPQETRASSQGQEDPLERDVAAHSRVLAWRIPWTEEPGGLQSMGITKSKTPRSTVQGK